MRRYKHSNRTGKLDIHISAKAQMDKNNRHICQLETCLLQLNVGSGDCSHCSLVFRLWMLYEPINDRIDIGWVLAGNHIATDFSISDRLESPAMWRGIFKNQRNCLKNFLRTQTLRHFTFFYMFSHGGWYWDGDHATSLQNNSLLLLAQDLKV